MADVGTGLSLIQKIRIIGSYFLRKPEVKEGNPIRLYLNYSE